MGKIHRELTAASPYMEVHPLERLRSLACVDPVKTATLLQIQPGRLVEGIEVVSDTVTGNLEIYHRVRAFFHTCAYVSIIDPSMFDFQTAINTSEKVFAFIQNTYQGRTPLQTSLSKHGLARVTSSAIDCG